ncbi:hypothetical protein V6N12_054032 [Hibiscus sabdariffa]|uniref:Uncharacterized protein n=1 Tax=Hibiscus sabdariffa TaxID=183260 RepID=A0ABR2D9B5_9ROSI
MTAKEFMRESGFGVAALVNRWRAIRFGMVERGCARDWVECTVVVTCCGKKGSEMQMMEVSMVIEDMKGKWLTVKDILVIMGEGKE